MLRAKGEIVFTLAGSSYTASNHFRVAFSFGNGMIYSGNIKSDNSEYIEGTAYLVDIEFFTIEDEAFILLQPVLKADLDVVMCAGSRILGIAKLSDFIFDNQAVLLSA